MSRNPFTLTGALGRDDPLFRGRAAELALLEQACVRDHKSFLLVYGGRQNGKTSLLLRLERRLQARLDERVRVCRVDFQDIPRVSTDAAFQHLIAELRRNLPHLAPATPGAGLPELRGFLEQALAGDDVRRLVLLLDELARLPAATREDLAHVIRALHTHRLVSPALAKTQFVLAGGLELYDLAIVQASTLRNVCEIVRLGDLGQAEAVGLLADGLGLVGVAEATATALGRAVYTRVGGHPYLTQRLGGLLAEQHLRGEPLDEAAVEALAWALLDEDDALLEHLRRTVAEAQLEGAARRLLTGSQRTSMTDDETARLELLGLARRAGRHWAPRSPLLSMALAEWLGLAVPPGLSLREMAQAAQAAAVRQQLQDLRLEQAAAASHAERAASPAEQVRLQRRANALADEIARIEAGQRAAPATAAPITASGEPLPVVDPVEAPPVVSAPVESPLAAPAAIRARRPSSLILPPSSLIHVPAGPFLMGSSEADKLANSNERPQHTLTLPDFWIGKTPVTNAQFRPFVEGDGYTNPAYWTQKGWQWREKDKIVKPRYWDDPKWNGADYPVVGVSWFEAVAYVRWLSVKTGQPFHLPSEPEWEKAARGPDGRIWPWGNSWEEGRCNSKEAGIEQTTPVGQYPGDANPYGALDMAGNVWEWCATQSGKGYPYQLEDEWAEAYLEADTIRMLRGGSWAHEQKYVRGACRNYHDPRVRSGFQGLRVASYSPGPNAES